MSVKSVDNECKLQSPWFYLHLSFDIIFYGIRCKKIHFSSNEINEVPELFSLLNTVISESLMMKMQQIKF